MMKRLVLFYGVVLLAATSLFAQGYKLEPIATAAPDLPAAYSALMQPQGYRIVGPKGPWCEIWFRKSIPNVSASSDAAIVFGIGQGTLLGILRFPAEGADRRGQPIKAGVYTLRYSNYPVDGAHQGAAPQRDFALLTPLAGDPDPNALPAFDVLVQQSIKGCGTPHPAVLSLENPSGPSFPSVAKEGDSDWVLSVKIGDLPLAIILVGKAEG